MRRRATTKHWLVAFFLLSSATIALPQATETKSSLASLHALLPVTRLLTLAPSVDNPRNSEGDFVKLQNGKWLFIYTHFVGGAGDHAKAFLASRESNDGGRTWSDKDQPVVQNEGGFNVMSVSLVRLKSGSILLFYLRKNSLDDCRPVMRISRDEAKTWSAPIECITNQIGYYVLNNSRVIQLSNGRLILPTALHPNKNGKMQPGRIVTLFSDDEGKSWRRSSTILEKDAGGTPINFMEPGVAEVRAGKLLMVIRTKLGCQYLSQSDDDGETWLAPEASRFLSPEAPATLVKIPGTKNLLMIWNDHCDKPEAYRRAQPPVRNPLAVAVSRDGGKTWSKEKIIEKEPGHGYCYTAVAIDGNRVLLAYCAHQSPWGLESTQISSFVLADLP